MSEEEKKALETVKEELQDQKQAFKYYRGVLGLYSNGEVETLLNLIEKQRKEIEELIETCDSYRNASEHCAEIFSDIIKPNYISKDKIRAKIKAFQDVKKAIIKSENKLLRASITYDIVRNDYCEKMLEELLEEK